MHSPSTHTPTWSGVRTKIRARAISDRGTLVLNNSRTGTTMRVRFEERRERQLAGGNPQDSPRASYAFSARDTKKLRAGGSDAGAGAPVPCISLLIKGHAPQENSTLPNQRSISLALISLLGLRKRCWQRGPNGQYYFFVWFRFHVFKLALHNDGDI